MDSPSYDKNKTTPKEKPLYKYLTPWSPDFLSTKCLVAGRPTWEEEGHGDCPDAARSWRPNGELWVDMIQFARGGGRQMMQARMGAPGSGLRPHWLGGDYDDGRRGTTSQWSSSVVWIGIKGTDYVSLRLFSNVSMYTCNRRVCRKFGTTAKQ